MNFQGRPLARSSALIPRSLMHLPRMTHFRKTATSTLVDARLIDHFCTLEIRHIFEPTHEIHSRSLGVIAIVHNLLGQIHDFARFGAFHPKEKLSKLNYLGAQFVSCCVTVFLCVIQPLTSTTDEVVQRHLRRRNSAPRVFFSSSSVGAVLISLNSLVLIACSAELMATLSLLEGPSTSRISANANSLTGQFPDALAAW